MIKNYLELNKFEVEKIIQFINRNKINKLSFEDIDKEIKSEEFDFGRGVILKIKGQDIIGMASIILKECDKKGIAYIIKLDINESIEDKRTVLCEIIEESKKIAKKYGAREVFLGTKDDTIIRNLNTLNIKKQYSAIRMTLDNITVKYSPLSLVKLSEENKKEYLMIYNDAFKEVPNAATLTESDIDEYIKKADENNCYIAIVNNEMIGFLQFNIKEGVGEFDLGLIKSARGKGYGKLLLETAISFLNSKKVKEIGLIVITKNTLAYDMYKKRGFKESELVSDWFKLD
ncbi:acetyltransferase [Caloranaerobacter azorensis H53214]|uniref:Acetyltransferase (GNAT) family protein n=2 Tax=Caloranaerobacter azorensis TaxID=116090 RepID=A0A1M5UP88_9FIRM|nr:GNAT family N-acetyltransferase [Caloranaerobacter azorensis]KGG81276.1 acetyltransferase [Caloranaerobacter azorensis H53214]SHH64483.1 Acetyltransferase (GNAT) family protein [Caloranaerobacter azorensis DSM 13643]